LSDAPSITNFPTKTRTPSSSPQSFTTTFVGGNGLTSGGSMFEIQAIKRLFVTAFDIHTEATSNTQVLVYFKRGTYVGFESSAVGWQKIVDTTVLGQGLGNPTPIPKNSFSAKTLEAGETASFYFQVTLISYTNYVAGEVLPSDSKLRFLSSVGIRNNFGTIILDRLWNGIIYY
jgi:hypothetical protein